MEAKYFQGSLVTGPVVASAARTWGDVIDIFRICPTLPMKRKDFLVLSKAERNREKVKLPFMVPACFKQSPSARVYAEATHCNTLWIDIDDSKDAAPFVSNPNLLYDALGSFNFAAYLTVSSTPEAPRLRIVIDAENVPVDQYRASVETIGALLALSKVTSESKVAVQAMFNAVMFLDSTDEEHPLIAHRVDGRTFTVNDISAAGTDQYQPSSNGTNSHVDHSPDALFFLKAPLPEITLSVAKEALSHIDAGCSYFEWLEVAAALRHQFSPHKADEAYEIFDEWSATGNNYGSPEDTLAKWKSLRPSPVGRMPVTIRSLLHKATKGGWCGQKVKDRSAHALMEWMEHAENATALLEQGIQKIVSAPMLSSTQESMLIGELRKHALRRFQVQVQVTALKSDLEKLKKQIKAKEREEQRKTEKVKEPMWAKGVCYVTNTKDFFRLRTGEKYKSDSFNAAYARHLLPTEDQLRDCGKPVTAATLCQPIVPPADYALNHLKITTVTDFAYDPAQPTELFFVDESKRYVNTYSPTYPELDSVNAEKAGAMFLAHLNNLVGEPEYRQTLIDYMAFMVQRPGVKIRWAPCIQGAEGCGKTLLAEANKAVHGKRHVKTIDGTAVVSGWNDWAFGYQLVVLEEVRVQGTNRYDIMNRLKPWITNEDIPINEKFRSSHDVRNITNYILFSNFHDALALTANDRRYFVIKSPLQTKQQVLALGPRYFADLFEMIKKMPGALRAWLANWTISPSFSPDGHAPRTKYVDELVADSANDLTAAIRRLLLEGDYPLIQYDIVSAKMLSDVLGLTEGLHGITGQQVAHVLREEGFRQAGRHAFGDERHYLWTRGEIAGALSIAEDRVKRGLKNLCMELIF